MPKGKVEDVIKRIEDKNLRFDVKKKMIDEVVKKRDLSLSDSALIYKDVDFGKKIKIDDKLVTKTDWTNHAKFRSELRDVDPNKVNKMVEEKLEEKLEEKDLSGDERFKKPGVGTAVVDYDLKKPDVDIITVWSKDIKGENNMNFGQMRVLGKKIALLVLKKIDFDEEKAVAIANAIIYNIIVNKLNVDSSFKQKPFGIKLNEFRKFVAKYHVNMFKKAPMIGKYQVLSKYILNKCLYDEVCVFIVALNLLRECGSMSLVKRAVLLLQFAKRHINEKKSELVAASNKKANDIGSVVKREGGISNAIKALVDKLEDDKEYVALLNDMSGDVKTLDEIISTLKKVTNFVSLKEKKIKNHKLIIQ